MVDAPAPPQVQENPVYPGGPVGPLVFDTFLGINTQASRPGIADEECAWMDGFMPLGKNNARTLYGVGSPIYTYYANSLIKFEFGNIGSNPVCIVFVVDGSIAQINTITKAVTLVAPAGTVQNPSISSCGISQWGNKYIIITATQTNGFWLWDGTNLYSAGTLGPDVTIDNNGLDYTSQPTITAFGGTGSGAVFTATLENDLVQSVSVLNPGSGYSGTDGVVLTFTGGGSPGTTATAILSVAGGTLSGATILNPGAGYTAAVTGQVIGGGGAGGTVSVIASGGSVTTVNILTPGEGYLSAAPPALYIEDTGNPVAQATIDVMPFGVSGSASETYTSRLWVVNGANVQYTAPESVVDFSSEDGGGEFQSTDPFLRVAWTQPIQTNGFLYLVADSSINYISGVQTSGNPPETTFTNQNADPEIGSPWAATVDVFSRNILLANPFGVHVAYGGAVTKVSDDLDGVYNTVPNFGGFTPSSAKAIIFGKKVWMVLIPIIDPITGQRENKLFMWNSKKWWTSNQDVNLVYIATQEINSVLTAYGTDGMAIYPLFQTPSSGFTKTIQSKLWDRPGYEFIKTTSRLWGMAYYYSLISPSLTISVDNENGESAQTYPLGPNVFTWTNGSGAPFTWIDNAAAIVTWYNAGVGVVIFPPQAVAQNGALAGLTLSTNAADMALISLKIDDEPFSYRG